MTNLPTGWARTLLGDPFSWGSGGTPSRSRETNYGGNIPWVVIGDLNDGLVTETSESITMAGLATSSAKWVEDGAVLLAMYGSIGKLGIAGRRLTTNQAIAFTQPARGLSNRYLFYYLMSQRSMLLGEGKGGTQSNISQTVIKAFPFVCAPTNEQQRIVDAIDSHLTRLDDAVASLERVQAKLKAYRASVLKAAVEGRLVPTEAALARDEKRDYEAAEVLLARILKDRRRRWEEAEFARLNAAGKMPKDDRWKAKYQEPPVPNTSNLPEPPVGWCWASVGQLIASLDQGWSPRCEKRPASFEEWGVMKTTAVQHLSFLEDENKALTGDLQPRPGLELRPGDLLVTRAGPRVRVGVCCLVRRTRPRLMLCDKVYRLRVNDGLSTSYVELVLNSPDVINEVESLKTGISDSGVNLTQDRFNELVLPLPPRREQDAIEIAVAERLSICEEVARTSLVDLQRAVRLEQAILKWAFEGKLVDQDPTDEPAEKLLARIRAERASVGSAKQVEVARQKAQHD